MFDMGVFTYNIRKKQNVLPPKKMFYFLDFIVFRPSSASASLSFFRLFWELIFFIHFSAIRLKILKNRKMKLKFCS